MTTKRKSGGGKLNRSEILQARVNIKQRVALEVMARKERRTVSSFIEKLIEDAAKKMQVEYIPLDQATATILTGQEPTYAESSVDKAVRNLWEGDEPERFVMFALCFPDLLNEFEETLWKIIKTTPYFWKHFKVNVIDKNGKKNDAHWWPVMDYTGLIQTHLKQTWPLLQDIAQGKKNLMELNKMAYTIGGKIATPKNFPEISLLTEW